MKFLRNLALVILGVSPLLLWVFHLDLIEYPGDTRIIILGGTNAILSLMAQLALDNELEREILGTIVIVLILNFIIYSVLSVLGVIGLISILVWIYYLLLAAASLSMFVID